jgi:amino acid adenylation domain-containing protein
MSRNANLTAPLSGAQSAMLLEQSLSPDVPLLNLGGYYVIDGPVDPRRLREAIHIVSADCDAFRIVFRKREDGTFQEVLPNAPVHYSETRVESDEAARAWMKEQVQTPFALYDSTLFRFGLALLPSGRVYIVVAAHHLVADGYALQVIVRRVCATYDAAARGERLPPAPSFLEYLRTDTGYRQSPAYERDRKFWQDQFRTEVPTLLPARGTSTWSSVGLSSELVTFDLPTAVLTRLAESAGVPATDEFHIVVASLYAFLARHFGVDDIPIALALSNRRTPEERDTAGMFISTVVARLRTSSNATFKEIVEHTAAELRKTYRHHRFPFTDLQREGTSRERYSMFPVVVSYLRFIEPFGIDGGVVHCPIRQVFNGYESRPLQVAVEDAHEPGRKHFSLACNVAWLEASAAAELGRRFEEFLREYADRAREPLRCMPRLSGETRRRVLEEWNATERLLDDRSFIDLFAEVTRRFPQTTAVSQSGNELSYAELHRLSDGLAANLIAAGVMPEASVAVLLPRSPELIVAALGIWKAGGVYLPLDPNWPAERMQFVLDDAGVRFAVTDAASTLAPLCEALRIVDLRALWGSLAEAAHAFWPEKLMPEQLAYVIYTSGSTGRPKGVMLHHRGLRNLAEAQSPEFGIRPGSRVLQFSSLAFDASISEIATTLSAGGTLCLPAGRVHVAELGALLRQERISVVTLPPSILSALEHDTFDALETLVVAGEACPPDTARAWLGRCRFINAYGPTEATVCATMMHCRSVGETTPIGRPITNVRLYVLDDELEPVPVGTVGELYIGGVGVARGYVNKPGLTADRFVADPFAAPGSRMYRTGDRARYAPDGNLEFLGRLDHQVKVRGHRIELGEIESTLLRHGTVRQAVATVAKDRAGDDHVVAYVEPAKQIDLWPSVAEWFVYDDLAYQLMASHSIRNAAYANAFRARLKDATVLEIGPGPEAVLARLAISMGAKKVYAVEVLESTYRQAKARIESLGLADKIVLLHGDSDVVELPESVDCCISEIVGSIAGAEGAASILNRARRWLKDPAAVIPARCETKIAAVAIPDDIVSFGFGAAAAHYVQKIFEQIGRPFDLRLSVKNVGREKFLSTTDVFEDLDFTGVVPEEHRHRIGLRVTADGRVTGFLLWLVLHASEEHVLDTLDDQSSWLPIYVPVFPGGCDVKADDRFELAVQRTLSANGRNPDYRIDGRLVRGDAPVRSFSYALPHDVRTFRGSPFYERLFGADGAVPRLQESSSTAWVEYLRAQLPEYMVPDAVVAMRELPLLSNGKVDRKSLASLPFPASRTERHVAASSAAEQALSKIWSNVLNADQIGIDDNFFDLGGTSLSLAQVQRRIRSELDPKIELKDLLTHPTIRALSRYMAQAAPALTAGPTGAAQGRRERISKAREYGDRRKAARHRGQTGGNVK